VIEIPESNRQAIVCKAIPEIMIGLTPKRFTNWAEKIAEVTSAAMPAGRITTTAKQQKARQSQAISSNYLLQSIDRYTEFPSNRGQGDLHDRKIYYCHKLRQSNKC
jgi:hypothetical protein